MTKPLSIVALITIAALLASCSSISGNWSVGDPRAPRHLIADVLENNTCYVAVDDRSGFWQDASLTILRQEVTEGGVTTATLAIRIGTDSAQSAGLFKSVARDVGIVAVTLWAKATGAFSYIGSWFSA